MTLYLKRLEETSAPPKKAKTFDTDQINELIAMSAPEGILPEKFALNVAFFLVGFYGGLRQ